jgi:hypothetical protein
MAARLSEIREGLAANLRVLEGLNVSAYMLSAPPSPYIWVRPAPDELIEYHRAMGDGIEAWFMRVEAFTGTPFDVAAQKHLDALVESTGPTSVKAALEADKTLGGVAQDSVVTSAHDYQQYQRQDGTVVLGCRWDVTVYMNGGS